MVSPSKTLLVTCLFNFEFASIATRGEESNSFQIVSRSEWAARPPLEPPSPLTILPSPYVIISHTATPPCYLQAQCMAIVRSIQSYHVDQNRWNDIGYNFLVGGDGKVYEGRGWDVEGAHTRGYNVKSIGLTFIGDFQQDQPTAPQLEASKKLLDYGLESGKISHDYKLLGQRQCVATASPGDFVYNIIKTWDHWSPIP